MTRTRRIWSRKRPCGLTGILVDFQGGNSRSWLLKIVRNTCYTWLRQNRVQGLAVELDEEINDSDTGAHNPETTIQLHIDQQLLRKALETLPLEFRELIVMREVEGLSYKEIALVASIPVGTVMSRLARARQQLKRCLVRAGNEEGSNGP